MPLLLVPEELDPPLFRPYRDVIHRLASPAAARALQPAIERWTTHCIDEVIESGHCDLVTDLTERVPAAVMLGWLGFPEDDWEDLYRVIHTGSLYVDNPQPDDPSGKNAASGREFLYQSVRDIVTKRQSSPRDDLTSSIVTQKVAGEPISCDFACGMVFTCMIGGIDTSTSVTSTALHYLHRNHALRSRLNPRTKADAYRHRGVPPDLRTATRLCSDRHP